MRGISKFFACIVTLGMFHVTVETRADESELSSVSALLDANDNANSVMKICSGKTIEGDTAWIQYGSSGIYVDVDTSSCGFDATPIYLVNMHGNSSNWATTGGSSAYVRSATGFRIYVRFSDGGPLDPDYANARGWHIQWLAIGN